LRVLFAYRSIADTVPYINIDLGSIVLIGYKGADAVAAATTVPATLPKSLGLPDCAPLNTAGVVNGTCSVFHLLTTC
jgi:hypothetical protein